MSVSSAEVMKVSETTKWKTWRENKGDRKTSEMNPYAAKTERKRQKTCSFPEELKKLVVSCTETTWLQE